MKKRLRISLGISLVLVTIAIFIYYVSKHSYLLRQLAHTPPLTIVGLLLLYAGWFGTVILILRASIAVCRRPALPVRENLLLNAYSTLVNFFIPGQGGPVVRGAYLKKRRNLRLRTYIMVTLLYYGFYAAISALLLLISNRPWWQTVLALLLVTSISVAVIWLYKRRSHTKETALDLSPRNIMYLLLATVLQAAFQVAIYATELHSVNTHVTLGQSLTYTGAANFALFVALTPGAIGIRESFLLLSRRLHHISSANIIAASIIDRSVFILFLALLFVITLSFHAKDTLHLKAAPADTIDLS